MSGRMQKDRRADVESDSAPTPVKVAPPQSDPLAALTRTASATAAAGVVFPKLLVGRADDPAERAADLAAERALGGDVAHRSAAGVDRLGGLAIDAGTESRIQQVRSRGGRPLDDHVRSTLEPGFGVDLSGVRIHTGAEPDGLNRALQAKAFTSGNDIFFRGDAYQPDTSEGLGLVAHEVAHVVQQSAGGGEVQRAFDPKDPDLSTITDVTQLAEGLVNKGVFFLTGQGGGELVAKFLDEDPRRTQFADVVMEKAGVGNPNSYPYGQEGVTVVADAIEAFASTLDGVDQPRADKLRGFLKNKKTRQAKGVLLMKKLGGLEAGNLAIAAADPAKAGDAHAKADIVKQKSKAGAGGIDPVTVFSSARFHEDLGRLYVADALLGSGDRWAYLNFPGKPGAKVHPGNFMATASGYVNTLDSETVLIGYEALAQSKQADKSATAWTKWLIEGGNVVNGLGVEASEAFTQNLLKMFGTTARKEMFAELIKILGMLSKQGIPDDIVDFATFDVGFKKGMLEAVTRLVGSMQAIISDAASIGGADGAGGNVDADAAAVKLEYMKAILPAMQSGTEIDDAEADKGYAAARAKAEQIVARKEMENRARLLLTFDTSLLPVPARPAALGKKQKAKRKIGRLAQKVTGKNKDKRGRSANAKDLRKASGSMSLDQLEKAHGDIGSMTDGSHRQEAASFEVGLRHAAMKTRVKARAFEDAEADVHAIMKVIPHPKARQDHLTPYGRSERYQTVATQYEQLLDGYGNQLGADETNEKKDIASAKKEIAKAVDEFEAELDYVRR